MGIGLTANGPQENVGLNDFACVGVNGQVSWLTVDFCDLCLTVDFDARVLHPRGEDILDVRIKSSEDGVTADEEMGLSPKGVEDTGEFYGDVTGADDDDSLRSVFEIEKPIRGDTEVSTGNFVLRGGDGVTTDGEADVISFEGVGLPVRGRDADLGGGNDGSLTFEKVYLLPFPVVEIDTTKGFYVFVALKLEGRPVEGCIVDAVELVPFGLTKPFSEICCVPHQLFWDASLKRKEDDCKARRIFGNNGPTLTQVPP